MWAAALTVDRLADRLMILASNLYEATGVLFCDCAAASLTGGAGSFWLCLWLRDAH